MDADDIAIRTVRVHYIGLCHLHIAGVRLDADMFVFTQTALS